MLKYLYPHYLKFDEATETTNGGTGGAPAGDGKPAPTTSGQAGDGATEGATGGERTEGGETTVSTEQTTTGGEPAGKKDDVNKRFSELTAAQKRAERERDEANARLTQALKAVETLTGQSASAATKKADNEDPEPTPPTFSDPEQFTADSAKYARELASWTARREVKAALAEEAKKRIEEGQQQQRQQTQAGFVKRRTEALTKYPDYTEVAEDPTLPISEPMARAIEADAMGTDVVYFLGQNRAEAERIHALPPGQQLVEFGMLKAKLLASQASGKVTQAKPPIKPVGGSTTTTKPLGDLPMDEYAAKRNAEIQASRRTPGTR